MDASAAVSSRLIGAIFVEKGLVTPDQLERAMQIQAETGTASARSSWRSSAWPGSSSPAFSPSSGRSSSGRTRRRTLLSRPSPAQPDGYPSSRCCAARSVRSSSTAVSSRTSSSRGGGGTEQTGQRIGEVLVNRAACHVSIWRAPWRSSGRTCRSCGPRSPWSRSPGKAAPSSSRLRLRSRASCVPSSPISKAACASSSALQRRLLGGGSWAALDQASGSDTLRSSSVRHQRTVARNRRKA